VDGQDALEHAGVYPPVERELFEAWREDVRAVLDRTEISIDFQPFDPAARGGRRGEHTDALKELLDEMCEVYRLAPGAAW